MVSIEISIRGREKSSDTYKRYESSSECVKVSEEIDGMLVKYFYKY